MCIVRSQGLGGTHQLRTPRLHGGNLTLCRPEEQKVESMLPLPTSVPLCLGLRFLIFGRDGGVREAHPQHWHSRRDSGTAGALHSQRGGHSHWDWETQHPVDSYRPCLEPAQSSQATTSGSWFACCDQTPHKTLLKKSFVRIAQYYQSLFREKFLTMIETSVGWVLYSVPPYFKKMYTWDKQRKKVRFWKRSLCPWVSNRTLGRGWRGPLSRSSRKEQPQAVAG